LIYAADGKRCDVCDKNYYQLTYNGPCIPVFIHPNNTNSSLTA